MLRYMASRLLTSMLAVLAVLVLASATVSVIDRSDRFGSWVALLMTVFRMPSLLHELTPFVVLVGVTAGLSRLSASNELLAMRACGMPATQMAGLVVALALLADLGTLTLRQFTALPGNERFEALRAEQLRDGQAREAFWLRDGDTFMRVESLSADGVAHRVRLYEVAADEWALRSSQVADTMRFEAGQWVLHDLVETHFDATATRVARVGSRVWSGDYDVDDFRLLAVNPRGLPPTQLLIYARRLDAQGLSGQRHWMSFWQQVFQPLDSAALALLALALALGTGPRSSVRLASAVLLGVGFRIVESIVDSFGAVLSLSPLAIALIPAALVALVGAVLIVRRA